MRKSFNNSNPMYFSNFITECFHGWSIVKATHYGTDCGNLVLCCNNTYIRVFFQLNGDERWTGFNVTLDHIESCENYGTTQN